MDAANLIALGAATPADFPAEPQWSAGEQAAYEQAAQPPAGTFAVDLRKQTAAVRLKHYKWGIRKALSASQRDQAADVFHAQRDSISAAKRLLNTKHEAYRRVTGIRLAATNYWKSMTVAYPDPGVRLIRRDRVEAFNAEMNKYREQLAEALADLQEHYGEMKQEARERLGDLFNASDYPFDIAEEFGISWEFPSVDAPAYLKQLNPALYEQEQQRIQHRFEEAVMMAEQAFTVELADMVSHLCERLAGNEDGKPKIFKDSSIDKLQGFFDRFSQLNVRSNDDLEKLIEQTKQIISGKSAEQLRKDVTLRQSVAEGLGTVRQQLDQLMIERPVRMFQADEEEAV